MDLELDDKAAIVTGASRGIGLAVAEGLGREGVRIALLARDPVAVETAAAKLRALGYDAMGVVADTRHDDQVDAAVATAAECFGGIDILVNGAARAAGGPSTGFADLDAKDLRFEMETKVLGYLRCIRAVAPGMIERGWGRVINIGGLGLRRTGSVVGAVRNVAVAAMSKNIADELGPKGINVTTVHPFVTDTENVRIMIRAVAAARGTSEDDVVTSLAADVSIGRIVDPTEIAHVVTFLASPLSVAINGDGIAAGGGLLGPIYY